MANAISDSNKKAFINEQKTQMKRAKNVAFHDFLSVLVISIKTNVYGFM